MLEGKSTPVFFTADSSVFNDPDFPEQSIYFTDLLGLQGNFTAPVGLKKEATVKAIIMEPTFFHANDGFLVYPGERIVVKKGRYNDFTFEIEGDKQRNKELLFFKTFKELSQYPIVTTINNPSVDSILAQELSYKKEIEVFENKSQLLFDSLINAYQVSDKFKKITKDYIKNKYSGILFYFYRTYKDSLLAHQLYKEKCKLLIPEFNDITERSSFNNSIIAFNEFADVILPIKIWKIENELELGPCFDTVENTFNGLAKDYLLSQIMYRAYKKRIQIPADYLERYDTTCHDLEYKKVVYNVKTRQEENDNKANQISSNNLLAVNGKKVTSLEIVLKQNKGKVILIDFWTYWCSPCLKEIPALKKLLQEYPKNELFVLSISLDKEVQPWQKTVIANSLEISSNYLLINSTISSFVEKYNIRSIPRYMLINREGEIVNTDAPVPSDPLLKQLIDKMLLVNK